MDGMNKLTALAALGWSPRGAAAARWGGKLGRRQRLIEMQDLGGECHHLFGAGEGPTEAGAGAKQKSVIDPSMKACRKLVFY